MKNRSPSSKKGRAKSLPKSKTIVKPSTSFSFRGKKKKSYHRKLKPAEFEYIIQQAAVRDFIRSERGKGRQLSYTTAQKDPKFLEAMETLRKLGRTKRRTKALRVEATRALKTLGRISKYYRGIYF